LIPRLPNLWAWFRTSRAIVMILSNGTMQINNFRDHSKMILCPMLGAISTIGPSRVIRTFKLGSLKEHGYSEEMAGRLKYFKKKVSLEYNLAIEILSGAPRHLTVNLQILFFSVITVRCYLDTTSHRSCRPNSNN